MVSRALPAMLVISLCNKAFRALVVENPPLSLSPNKYMPVANMVTATFPRSSIDMAASWFCTVMSSGAAMVNSSPMFSNVRVMDSPTSKETVRGVSFSVTVARIRSDAEMFKVGFRIGPLKST